MSILILTGPAGAGKNTIGQILAKKRSRCAVIDVDTVRHMVVQPHHAPWSGEEGKAQLRLGIKNACMLAKNFQTENFDVIILDVVNNWSLNFYKESLVEFKVVLLLPTLGEVKKRNKNREFTLEESRVEQLYKEQEEFTGFDEKIDNTNISPEEVAKINCFFKVLREPPLFC